jgi:hypothetical protein
LIFDKGTKNIQWKKKSSSTNVAMKNLISACRKLKVDPWLSPCASINSKWIKNINIRPENLKVAQDRPGNTLELIGIGSDFLNRTQMAQELRERIDKWDYVKLKTFCTTKEMAIILKRLLIEWEKMFASSTFDKDLITRIYRELKILNFQEINDPMKK